MLLPHSPAVLCIKLRPRAGHQSRSFSQMHVKSRRLASVKPQSRDAPRLASLAREEQPPSWCRYCSHCKRTSIQCARPVVGQPRVHQRVRYLSETVSRARDVGYPEYAWLNGTVTSMEAIES